MMEKRKAGFVVLHYLAEDVTRQCVSQLLTCFSPEEIVIAVVDNASANGSGRSLQEYYRDEPAVHVLINEKNLGFARGNNVGYTYLRERFALDYMIVLNNDVMIHDEDLLVELEKIHRETDFDVLGPDIYCPYTHTHQNPSRLKELTFAEVQALEKEFERREAHFPFWYGKNKLKRVLRKEPAFENSHQQGIDWQRPYSDPVLHGACYIFAASFLKVREYAFHPGTFLYCEEEILHLECRKAGLRVYYTPEIQVQHLEDVSTDRQFKNDYRKAKMKNSETRKSLGLLKSLYE